MKTKGTCSVVQWLKVEKKNMKWSYKEKKKFESTKCTACTRDLNYFTVYINSKKIKMGSWWSSNKDKKVASAGIVNNNLVIEDTIQVHNTEMIILLAIIAACSIIQLVCFIYVHHVRKLKKKYRTVPTKQWDKIKWTSYLKF